MKYFEKLLNSSYYGPASYQFFRLDLESWNWKLNLIITRVFGKVKGSLHERFEAAVTARESSCHGKIEVILSYDDH